MATKAKSICRHAGCGKLIDEPGHCEKHARQLQRQSDAERGSSNERGYTRRWQKARATYLSRHPLCVECERNGHLVPATDVDHIIPPRLKEAKDSGDTARIVRAQELFWNSGNWQSLCHHHHSRKTAREDGGFGRARNVVIDDENGTLVRQGKGGVNPPANALADRTVRQFSVRAGFDGGGIEGE